MLGTNLGILLRQKAYAGDRDGALAVLNEHPKNLPVAGQPNDIGSWTMLLLAVEGLFVLANFNEREISIRLCGSYSAPKQFA
jgi:hypothetical protein